MAGEEDEIQGDAVTPEQLAAAARRNRSQSISYTCTEPAALFDLVLETTHALTKIIQ
jgi:pyruvate-formate lyase-activating enzyme